MGLVQPEIDDVTAISPLLRNIYVAFAVSYLGGHFKCRIPECHHQIYEAIQIPELDQAGSDRLIIEAPTRWGKSELDSFVKPLVDGVGGRKKNILEISATGTLATHWLGEIKGELETNRDLRAEYKIKKGNVWTKEEIHIISKHGDCHITSKGLGFQLRGFGYDLIIMDDVETDEMVRSETQRQYFEHWFKAILMGRLEPGCQIIWIGTFLSQLAYLYKAFKGTVDGFEDWKKIMITALDENDKSTWEDRYPTPELHKLRQSMGRHFSAEKMGRPLPTENAVFQEDWLVKTYDKLPDQLATVVSLDPQDSKSEYANWGALTCWSKDTQEKYYLRDCQRGKWGMFDSIRALVFMDKKHKPRASLVESRVLDKNASDWRDAIKREATNQHTVINPIFIKPTSDKVNRAHHILEPFEKGNVYFPSNQYLTSINRRDLIKEVQILKDELLEFPDGENDDYTDSTTQNFDYLKKQKVGAVSQRVSAPLPTLKPDPVTHRLK